MNKWVPLSEIYLHIAMSTNMDKWASHGDKNIINFFLIHIVVKYM